LTALENIVGAMREVYGGGNDTKRTYDVDKPLDLFKDEILGIFTAGLKIEGASPALLGLDSMVKISGLLSDEELGFVVHSINELLIGANDLVDDSIQ
jgi:DNA repair/transcription protein MET18/MMS19